jgi:apoptosis-inducing factor 2
MGASPSTSPESVRVVVIGGGYAGVWVSKELEKKGAAVTMIEKRDVFVHNIAGLRACVKEGWDKRILIPMDRALKRGRVVQASSQRIGTRLIAHTTHVLRGY